VTAGFVITAIVCACGVLVIAWARRRTKSQSRRKAKRTVDLHPARALNTQGQFDGPTSPRVKQPTAVATAEVPTTPATSDEQPLFDHKRVESPTSSEPLEGPMLDSTLSEHRNKVQQEPFVSELEIVNALTSTEHVQDPRGISEALPAIIDHESNTASVSVDSDSSRINEAPPASGTAPPRIARPERAGRCLDGVRIPRTAWGLRRVPWT
jgi:hypothetical protein